MNNDTCKHNKVSKQDYIHLSFHFQYIGFYEFQLENMSKKSFKNIKIIAFIRKKEKKKEFSWSRNLETSTVKLK